MRVVNSSGSNLRPQIRWQSPVFDPSGYADEARYLLREAQSHARIRLEPTGRFSTAFHREMDPAEREALEHLIATPLAADRIQLVIAPGYALRRDAAARYSIGRTTFETDRLPADWIAACNRMNEIWVPTAFNVETFRRAGVTVPIYIVPQGVDTERFRPDLKPLEIAGRRGFAFLSVFEWIYRKGWDVLLRGWAGAFGPEDDVCLIIRSYLPNVTEGTSSIDAVNERINAFLREQLGTSRDRIAPIIVLGQQLAQLDMPRLYASADAFVLPTRGEGWGRPYIEAMACGLPVLGTRWGAQLAFMHDGNSLLNDIEALEIVDARMEFPFYRGHQWARPSVEHLKQLLRRVVDDPAAARKFGETAATEVREKWTWKRAGEIMLSRFTEIRADGPCRGKHSNAQTDVNSGSAADSQPIAVSWEGSFTDFGSLSHVNREITRELEKFSDIELNRLDIRDAGSKTLSANCSSPNGAHNRVTVRHAWPPNWRRPNSGKLVVVQPWEFGSLPEEWVRKARDVDEFWVPSEYVRRIYVASGVPESKVVVVPNGVDAKKFCPQATPMNLHTEKKFKFLFVGGTIGRKGPDVLLKAYLSAFTAADDVCLVIKDFGGKSVYAGQTFEAQIRAAQSQPNAPEILYLSDELPTGELPGLYTACDCFVLPFRGEGFGMPILEAMACGLPVVITAGGAAADFAPDELAYRIPSERRVFGNEVSGMKLVGPGWLLEPNSVALIECMQWIVVHRDEAKARGRSASKHARCNWTWKRAAAIAAQRIRALAIDAATDKEPVKKLSSAGARADFPACARVGRTDEAGARFDNGDLSSAWNTAVAVMSVRPFHPEAWLLLGEIAAKAGAFTEARSCAQRARDSAPGWKAPKRFLNQLRADEKSSKRAEWLRLPSELETQRSTRQSRLTVCIIAKNEEQFIEQCLKSVKPIAHQIVVVDTGSTDRTVEMAKAHGAEVHSFEWCDDFSAARNAALEHATGDWILMLDADEELPANQHERLRADMSDASAIAFRLPLVNRSDEAHGQSFVPRLLRNAPGAFYRGRIHEQIFSSLIALSKGWGLETRIGTAQLLHHGYAKEIVRDRNKIDRNLKLLRLAIEEQPNDVNLVINLGLELVRSREIESGLAHYRNAFRLMSAQPANEVVPELREVLLTQFTSHLYKVRAHDEIVQTLTSSLATRGGLTASLHFALGLSLFELKRYRESAEQMEQCLERRNERALSPINTDILTAAPRHCLALSLARAGDAAGALKAFDAALEEPGCTDELKVDYAKFLAAQHKSVEALHQLNEIVQRDSRNAAAWRLGGEIALSRPEFLEFARDWTGEAIRCVPDDITIAAQRAEVLMLQQEFEAAAELWNRVEARVRQPRVLAARILCAIEANRSVPAPENTAEEIATSRAFVDWYRRLVNAGARDAIIILNARVDVLRGALPSAAPVLDAVVSEAGRGELAAK